MAINLLAHKEIDFEQYNHCIANAKKTCIYANSWYLNALCKDHWFVLVLDNYKAVMPVPFRKIFFESWVSPVTLVQKLGIFTQQELNQNTINAFAKQLSQHKIVSYSANFKSSLLPNPIEKKNQELNLNSSYLELYKNYRKDRKKALRKAANNQLYYKDSNNLQELILLYEKVFGQSFATKTAPKLLGVLANKGLSFQRNIYWNKQLIGAGFFAIFNQRVYYLFAANTKEGQRIGSTTFLIDSVIQQFANQNYIFDFEGSTIPNVFNFYKSFGAKTTFYYTYEPKHWLNSLLTIKRRII